MNEKQEKVYFQKLYKDTTNYLHFPVYYDRALQTLQIENKNTPVHMMYLYIEQCHRLYESPISYKNVSKKGQCQFFHKDNSSSTQINNYLNNSLQEEMPIAERQVYYLAQQFRDHGRDQIERRLGSGRKKTQRTEENIEMIGKIIEEDPHASFSSMVQITAHFKRRSQIKKFQCEMDSTSAQQLVKIKQSQQNRNDLEKNYQKCDFFDEKWVYLTPLPPQQNVRSWADNNKDRPQLERRGLYNKKYMIIVAINFNSDYYLEVLEEHESVNSERYTQFLSNMLENIEQRRYVIMHDNAKPHKSNLIVNFQKNNNIQFIDQPAYSPDVNLLDRFIFRNFETARQKMEFKDNEEIVNFLETYLDSRTIDAQV